MDAALDRLMRETLASQQFGVLATIFSGRLHTATIHFAETPRLELAFAIRPATLKASHIEANPKAAFQVDNRDILPQSRERFTRIGFEGTVRKVEDGDPAYQTYRQTFADKLPVGARLLTEPDIALYVFTPVMVRIAAGGMVPEDVEITVEPVAVAAAATNGPAAWPSAPPPAAEPGAQPAAASAAWASAPATPPATAGMQPPSAAPLPPTPTPTPVAPPPPSAGAAPPSPAPALPPSPAASSTAWPTPPTQSPPPAAAPPTSPAQAQPPAPQPAPPSPGSPPPEPHRSDS